MGKPDKIKFLVLTLHKHLSTQWNDDLHDYFHINCAKMTCALASLALLGDRAHGEGCLPW